MQAKDQQFTIGAGQTIWAEKSHYPDLVRLVIPKDQAVQLAQQILQRYEAARPEHTHLVEIPLFGQLEEVDDE
ncbi:TPA: hypothetical protein QDZ28_000789 [Pseudomonas putida]|nr:hypothetical protein [Pseudomonas putida]